MNYVYANGILWMSEGVEQVIFEESDAIRDIIDLNSHTLTVQFPIGTTSSEVATIVQLISYEPDLVLTPGTFDMRTEDTRVNGWHIFYKNAETWITLTQIISSEVDQVLAYEEENTVSILLPNTEVTEEYKDALLHLNSLLIIPVEGEEPYITNIDSLSIHGSFDYKFKNKTVYHADNYWINSLDYSAAFIKFLKWKYPKYQFYQSSDVKSVPDDHQRIYVFNTSDLFTREMYSSHRIYDPLLGWLMKVEITINGEFLTDDIFTFQTFVSDWNNDLDINKEKEFRTHDDYTKQSETYPKNSKQGWSAALVWNDFVEGNLDNTTSSKMFENSRLYCVPIQCKIVCTIAKGTEEPNVVLDYMYNLMLKMNIEPHFDLKVVSE